MSDSQDKSGVAVGGVNLTPKAIIALIVGVAALIFIFSNTNDVTLSWLWLELSAPGWVMLLALFACGLAVGFFLGRNRYKR
jgi:uncharacterized integral membrane protein